jgi:hypothetical protein
LSTKSNPRSQLEPLSTPTSFPAARPSNALRVKGLRRKRLKRQLHKLFKNWPSVLTRSISARCSASSPTNG